MHHLYQNSGLFRHSVIGTGLQLLGYTSVGVFFFLSGYGLMRSYQRKGGEYLRTFPKKRLLPFYLMMVLLIVIYTASALMMGERLTVREVAQSFLFGGTVISKGWYLQMQLLCYIFFYFSFTLCGNERTGTVVLTLLTAIYILVMMILDYPITWYAGTPLFLAGLLFARCRKRVDEYLERRMSRPAALLGAGLLFCAAWAGYRMEEVKWLDAVCLTFLEGAFVSIVLLIIGRVRINCGLTRMLGAISLEVYVMQGLCLSFFQSRVIHLRDPHLYVIAVCISTAALAAAIHPAIKGIFSVCGGRRDEQR